MKQNTKIMMDLIRSGAENHEPDASKFLELPETEQLEIAAMARKHSVGHLLGDALERCPATESLSVTRDLFQEAMNAREQTSTVSQELELIRQQLDQAQIPYIPAKGIRIREYYPAPWMRPCHDIDLIVHEDQAEAAAQLLCRNLKYKITNKHSRRFTLHAPSGLQVDLHFRIKGRSRAANRVLAQVWDYSTPVEGSCEYLQSNEFFLFHIISYMANHIMGGGCGTRPLLDLYVLKHKLPRDQAKVEDLCRHAGLDKFYANIRVLMMAWFEDGPMTPEAEHLGQFILAGGQYGSRKNRIAVAEQVSGHKIKHTHLMAPQPFETLSTMYPSLKSNRWLLPAYQVWYWGQVLSSGQLQEEYSDRAASDSIDDAFASKIGRLLKENGLL